MGDVVIFQPRGSKAALDPQTQKFVDQTCNAMQREAQRRASVYVGDDVTPELLRIVRMYPTFRLTHARRARRCLFCGHRIAPLELHFVHSGSYICQSGTCTKSDAVSK
jgi:hypothetical protein